MLRYVEKCGLVRYLAFINKNKNFAGELLKCASKIAYHMNTHIFFLNLIYSNVKCIDILLKVCCRNSLSWKEKNHSRITKISRKTPKEL